jgi:hypothetical protein
MSLILFNKLNVKNKRRIINIVSGNYPYEDIEDIYNFFLNEIFESNTKYFIRKDKHSLVGLGYKIDNYAVYLYWPFIYSKDKYLGQHKNPFFRVEEIDIQNFINIYKSIIDYKNKKIFACSSNYGMEKVIKDIFLNHLGLFEKEIPQESYWGEKYKNFIDIKNDSVNYQQVDEIKKVIRQNPQEKIYVLSN